MVTVTDELVYWIGEAPKRCDLCTDKLVSTWVDGRTTAGVWANMCPRCHLSRGVGLGIGKGQMYKVGTKEKIAG